jgi:hypothetical protein
VCAAVPQIRAIEMHYVRVRFVGYEEAHDSVSVGLGGLRLFATLAHGMGIVDIVFTAPPYAPVDSARSEISTRLP